MKREAYVCALLNEIKARATKEYLVDTIYFGGGTPSLLSVEQIGRILSTVRENFVLCDDAEITLECNPSARGRGTSKAPSPTDARDVEDAIPYGAYDYFSGLKRLGVNRLSLGVQSAVDTELKLIGRQHSFEEAKRTFFDAREADFENISLDLMLGIPSQNMDSLERSVKELVNLAPEHISIYSLQLEEGTPLYKMRDRYSIADDDMAADMYELVVRLMKSAGYKHYEISNFAREGKESRHNSKYWRLDEYLGLGLASHSDFQETRSENTRDMSAYLEGKYYLSGQEIGVKEREVEFIMLGLRMSEGISKTEFFCRFGVDFDEKYGEKLKKLEKAGYVYLNGDRVALNERGFELSNMILADILDFDY